MRKRVFILFVGVLTLVASGCDWSQWGASPSHSGVNSFEDDVSRASVPAYVASTMSQPAPTGQAVTAGQYVFVQRNGALTALDSTSYGVAWVGALPPGSTIGSVPAVDGDSRTVFVVVSGASSPQLIGFDVDGIRNCNAVTYACRPLFVADLGTATAPASAPTTNGGKVFANGANALYAFDATGHTNCVVTDNTAHCTSLWSAPADAGARGLAPALGDGVLYDSVTAGSGSALGVFDAGSGQLQWTGSVGTSTISATPSVAEGMVFVPAGSEIDAFPAPGCGTATCAPSFSLHSRNGDLAGQFLASASITASNVFATNANGSLYAWPKAGCGTSTCQPSNTVALDAPIANTSDYAQMPAVVNGLLFVTARRVVLTAEHVFVVALDTNLAAVASWDLGAGSVGPGLASVSEAYGVVYAPTDSALIALHGPAVEPLALLTTSPLALTPAFDPSIFDYVLRCAAGTNSVTFTMTAAAGGTVQLVAPITTSPSPVQSSTVNLNENQAAVIRATNAAGKSAEYWIRCLPHDFPPLAAARTGNGPTPGWYLIGDNFPPANSAAFAMILDTNGTPVWYRRSKPGAAVNITPLGHDEIAFMQNLQFGGFTTDPNARYDVYNLDTNTVSAIKAVGLPVDQHELATAPNGDHLLLSYPPKSGVDLTGLAGSPTPGPNSTIADCVIQDVDPQGNLVWQWTASDHFDPRTATTLSPVPSQSINGQTVYDVFHCNSIDPNPNGNVLVSARHMNAVFEVRRSDGHVLWKMGGTPSNRDGAEIITVQNDPDGAFVMQHDARYGPNGVITMYDNQTPGAHPARAVEYSVNHTNDTAQPVFSFETPTGRSSCCTGDYRHLAEGNRIIGWGFLAVGGLPVGGPMFTELDRSGNTVFDVSMTGGASYRAVKAPATRYDLDRLRATAGQ